MTSVASGTAALIVDRRSSMAARRSAGRAAMYSSTVVGAAMPVPSSATMFLTGIISRGPRRSVEVPADQVHRAAGWRDLDHDLVGVGRTLARRDDVVGAALERRWTVELEDVPGLRSHGEPGLLGVARVRPGHREFVADDVGPALAVGVVRDAANGALPG